jgi:hypothetical protein
VDLSLQPQEWIANTSVMEDWEGRNGGFCILLRSTGIIMLPRRPIYDLMCTFSEMRFASIVVRRHPSTMPDDQSAQLPTAVKKLEPDFKVSGHDTRWDLHDFRSTR